LGHTATLPIPGSRQFTQLSEDARYAAVPLELKLLPAWLVFRIEAKEGGKPKKVPCNIAGRKADFTNDSEWMPFETALQMMRRGGYDGVGIALDKRFGLVGYDADSCIVDGALSEEARQHVATLNSYTEVSLSGTGIHVLARGDLPREGRKRNGFEMYCHGRFFVVTGRHVRGTPNRIEHRQPQIDTVHAAIFGQRYPERASIRSPRNVTQFAPITQVRGGTEKPREWSGSRSDDTVRRLILRDSVAARYYNCGADKRNPSEADFALGCKLAFYSGGNLPQMRRLFVESALGKRAKCLSRRGNIDYLQHTLERCLQAQTVFYGPRPCRRKPARPVGRPLSETTKAVLELYRSNLSLRPIEIANSLKVKPATVRQILSRYGGKPELESGSDAIPKDPSDNAGQWTRRDRSEPHSGSQDLVLDCIGRHPSWVMFRTLLKETSVREDALGALLQALQVQGLIDADGRGRYRGHRERKPRVLKPCRSKAFPRSRSTNRERSSITRSELIKRGWPAEMIETRLSHKGVDYKEKYLLNPWRRRLVKTRLYSVSRIKAHEVRPDFERERALILSRRPPNVNLNTPTGETREGTEQRLLHIKVVLFLATMEMYEHGYDDHP